jgi:hypothetical protein
MTSWSLRASVYPFGPLSTSRDRRFGAAIGLAPSISAPAMKTHKQPNNIIPTSAPASDGAYAIPRRPAML